MMQMFCFIMISRVDNGNLATIIIIISRVSSTDFQALALQNDLLQEDKELTLKTSAPKSLYSGHVTLKQKCHCNFAVFWLKLLTFLTKNFFLT